MQAYQSHKIVNADKIADISEYLADQDGHSFLLASGESIVLSVNISERIMKMVSEDGGDGYLVQYDANTSGEYWSWSPAEAFENGYRVLQELKFLDNASREMARTVEGGDIELIVNGNPVSVNSLIESLTEVRDWMNGRRMDC